jgi:hypothetical protein
VTPGAAGFDAPKNRFIFGALKFCSNRLFSLISNRERCKFAQQPNTQVTNLECNQKHVQIRQASLLSVLCEEMDKEKEGRLVASKSRLMQADR